MGLVLIIYLIGLLEFITVIRGTLWVLGLCLLAFIPAILVGNSETYKKHSVKIKKVAKIWVFALATCLFIPSEDTAYKMLAAYGVSEAIASEDVRRISGKSLELLEKTIGGYLSDE